MRSLDRLAAVLREKFDASRPMTLLQMADAWWPDQAWVRRPVKGHRGGPTTGERVAGAVAAKMQRAGLLREVSGSGDNKRYRIADRGVHGALRRAA